MSVLDALRRLDDRVFGKPGSNFGPPEGGGAEELWQQLTETQRQTARWAAESGGVARDPYLALVIAPLIDQQLSRVRRHLAWYTAVLLTAALASAAAGFDLLGWAFVGGAAASPIGYIIEIKRLTSARRSNLDRARQAGLDG